MTYDPIFYYILFGHIIGLIVGFGAVLVIDTFGLLWLLKMWGVDLSLVRKVAAITQRLIWLGFSLLVATGIGLLVIKARISDLTIIKLFFVVMVGLNGIFLHYIKKGLDSLGENISNVPSKYFFRISLASTISQVGWWGATLIGFYNRHIGKPMLWTENYLAIIGVIILVFGVAALVGHKLTADKPVQLQQ